MQLEREMDQQTADLNGIEEQQIENQKAFSAIKSLQVSRMLIVHGTLRNIMLCRAIIMIILYYYVIHQCTFM